MLTLQQVKDYRDIAAKHPGHKSAEIINTLLDELEPLRKELNRLRARELDKSGPYMDGTLMPFGKYKGEPLHEVPEDYLRWWLEQNPDWDVIYIEFLYAKYPEKAIAGSKLKLHDYVMDRFNRI